MQCSEPIALAEPLKRQSLQSRVVWGSRIVTVGGGAPVRIQSMTNTDTVDVVGTAIQVKELAQRDRDGPRAGPCRGPVGWWVSGE